MDLQDYRDELARKSLEKLEHLSGDFDAGRIGVLAYRTAVNTIWWITSGLIDKASLQVIELAQKMVEEDYQRRMKILNERGR